MTAAQIVLFSFVLIATSVKAQGPWRVDCLHYVVSFYDDTSTYEDAKTICADIGATPVQLDDYFVRETLYEFIEEKYYYSEMFWIGAERTGPGDDDWNWVDGTKVNMSLINWEFGQPDNRGGKESSMQLWSTDNSFWDISPELDYLHPICQERRGPADPWKLQTTNYHLTFYDEAASDWNEANAVCAEINGSLIQLDDDDVRDNVLRAIGGAENVAHFWIGATNEAGGWTWSDGTLVNMSINWAPGQPDPTTNKTKLLIRTEDGTFQNDDGTFSKAGTICQRKRGDYCQEYVGTCRNGGTCTNKTEKPYFVCKCTDNFYGDNCDFTGKPTIFNATSKDCDVDAEIMVAWKPSPSALTEMYRFSAEPLDPAETRKDVFYSYPYLNESFYNRRFKDLAPSTLYNVTITLCPRSLYCIPDLSASLNTTTGLGLPGVVNDSTVDKINNSLCRVTWDYYPSTDPQDQIESFQVVSNSSYVYQPQIGDAGDIFVDIETEKLEYSFATIPNREYTFTVAPRSRTCLGPKVTAVGECITDFAPPDELKTPELLPQETSTERDLLITIPAEVKGPISCIFVIVKVGSIDNDEEEFDTDDLNRISSNSLGDEVPIGTEYLSMVIAKSRDIAQYSVTIGKKYQSSCNISQYTGNDDVTGETYVGRNWPVLVDQEYSYYIVTSTPTGPDLTKFQRSPVGSFRNGSPRLLGNMGWMIGIAIYVANFLQTNINL